MLEALAAGRWLPLEVRLAEHLDAPLRQEVATACEARGVAVAEHPGEQLTRWCRTGEHQGLLALMPPYPYAELEAVVAGAREPPLFLILDRIQDPHNFGAILRAAEVFGVDAVFVGEHAQADVTPHVARSSAGAVNHVAVCRIAALPELPGRLRQMRGVRTWTTLGGDAAPLSTVSFQGPCALVIGNEGDGVSPDLAAACDGAVTIPQVGRVQSLNAAVATGVLLYEVRRQRSQGRSSGAE